MGLQSLRDRSKLNGGIKSINWIKRDTYDPRLL